MSKQCLTWITSINNVQNLVIKTTMETCEKIYLSTFKSGSQKDRKSTIKSALINWKPIILWFMMRADLYGTKVWSSFWHEDVRLLVVRYMITRHIKPPKLIVLNIKYKTWTRFNHNEIVYESVVPTKVNCYFVLQQRLFNSNLKLVKQKQFRNTEI